MDQALIDSTQRWTAKASHDLIGARRCSEGNDVTLDVAIYHCQQAAEKSLKAILHFHGEEVPKTHNLKVLLPLCANLSAGFISFQADAALLNPLATAFRYPDDFTPLNPTRTEFDEALAAAQRIYDFVVSLLPAETHPT